MNSAHPRLEMSPGLAAGQFSSAKAPYVWEQAPYLNAAISRLLQRERPRWMSAASFNPPLGPAAP